MSGNGGRAALSSSEVRSWSSSGPLSAFAWRARNSQSRAFLRRFQTDSPGAMMNGRLGSSTAYGPFWAYPVCSTERPGSSHGTKAATAGSFDEHRRQQPPAFAPGIRIATRDHPRSRLDGLVGRMLLEASGSLGESHRPEFVIPPNGMCRHARLPLNVIVQSRRRTSCGTFTFGQRWRHRSRGHRVLADLTDPATPASRSPRWLRARLGAPPRR